MFPGYRVHAITNGVHAVHLDQPTALRGCTTSMCPAGATSRNCWCAPTRIPDDAIWAAHQQAKRALVERVQALTGVRLDPELPILGFARRMTAYKRPDLLFTDLERLKAIAREASVPDRHGRQGPSARRGGKQLIAALHRHIARTARATIPMAYLPDYDMELARLLVAGVDVWLNTPLPPLEASGTSGMKAAFNGVPSLSVLDGWWIEGCIEGRHRLGDRRYVDAAAIGRTARCTTSSNRWCCRSYTTSRRAGSV